MSKTKLQVNVAVMTVDRPKNYVHKVLASLPKNLPIRLVVGSPSYGYLERYQGNPSIEIIGVEPAEWMRFKSCRVEHRASWNYWRCFIYGVKQGCRNGILIFEDDIIPVRGWVESFSQTIEQIEREYGREYVLALYTAYTDLPKPVAPDIGYTRYPVVTFANTQAMYYPETVRIAFAEYLRNEGVESFRMPYDRLLSEYLRLTGTPLFATIPCMVEHIGAVSTGLCPVFHQAGFRR